MQGTIGPYDAPARIAFGGGASESVMHPAVMVALLLAILLMLLLPRKYVIIPFLLCLFLVPRGQQLYVFGTHWYVVRILILAGVVRLARAKFQVAGGLNGIDKAFALWALCRAIAVLLLNRSGAAAVNQAAFWLEAFGGYFLLRHLIQDEEDIARAAKVLGVLVVILGACMLNERLRNVNIFGYLGGAPMVPEFRNDRSRSQATFGHSILAGCFGATLVPLYFWLWKSGRAKTLAAAGLAGSTLMVLMSNSSTPVLAYTAGLLSLSLWPFRRYMRALRWGIVLTIVGLDMAMKAPVWFIIERVNVVGGSGGWNRANLIDVFMRHFKDWWLIGTNQAAYWGFDMWDLSNQFVAEGETGGLVTLVLFIVIISRSFSRLGMMRKRVDRTRAWLCWSLGAVMLAHIVAYFGVSYWDQNQIWWWTFLAMISAATVALQSSPSEPEQANAEQDSASS